jgi:hypothetical protein
MHAFVSFLTEAVAWLCQSTDKLKESDRQLLSVMCPVFRFLLIVASLSAVYYLQK